MRECTEQVVAVGIFVEIVKGTERTEKSTLQAAFSAMNKASTERDGEREKREKGRQSTQHTKKHTFNKMN